ncbi:MAG: hypothetical protein ABI886_05095 [Betaproteobacteria bacterium]
MPAVAPPVDPFAPLTRDTLRAMASSGVVRAFPKNTVLIHAGGRRRCSRTSRPG